MMTATMYSALKGIIPRPVSMMETEGTFALTTAATIIVDPPTDELLAIGRYLAERLRPSTGYGMHVLVAEGAPPDGNLHLTTASSDPALGDEGYELTITPQLIEGCAAS